jgi:hypothetical protein
MPMKEVALALCLAALGGTVAADTVKTGAPIEVKGTLADRSAAIEVTFHSPARDVQIDVSGADGLVVQGDPTPVKGRSVEAGETLRFEIGFVPAGEHSNLAVVVSGSFGGLKRSRAASFTIGEPGRAKTSAAQVDDKGRRVKLGHPKD